MFFAENNVFKWQTLLGGLQKPDNQCHVIMCEDWSKERLLRKSEKRPGWLAVPI